MEGVIFSVAGVQESLVCATDNGPAAAVVRRPNAEVTKEQIHKVVNGEQEKILNLLKDVFKSRTRVLL